jgi:hypothetical protein
MRHRGYGRETFAKHDGGARTSPGAAASFTVVFRRALPVLAATLLVACGGSDPVATPATDAPAPAVAPPVSDGSSDGAPPTGVPAALQLTAPLVGGGEIELGALAGRPVLLWFWAPW